MNPALPEDPPPSTMVDTLNLLDFVRDQRKKTG